MSRGLAWLLAVLVLTPFVAAPLFRSDDPLPVLYTLGGDFTLDSTLGSPLTLSDLRGQLVLLNFGYTGCPDVCPVTLTEFLQIRSKLGQAADQVSFVFITVDPERDTAERMRKYLTNFDPEIIGLTGDRSDLEPVWADYGVYQAKVEGTSEENYLVDHSSRVYVIDRQGNLRLTYLFGTENQLITEDVRHLASLQQELAE